MLRTRATVEGLTALGADNFLLRLDFTQNAMGCEPILDRLQLEKLRALCAGALSATQDAVEDPALLARVVTRS